MLGRVGPAGATLKEPVCHFLQQHGGTGFNVAELTRFALCGAQHPAFLLLHLPLCLPYPLCALFSFPLILSVKWQLPELAFKLVYYFLIVVYSSVSVGVINRLFKSLFENL